MLKVYCTQMERPFGFYIPLERDQDEVRRAIAKLGVTVEKVLEDTGMSEEELAQLFDLRRQLPE